jgi:hypothetical protein
MVPKPNKAKPDLSLKYAYLEVSPVGCCKKDVFSILHLE